ncbi:MAG TPA: ABC transporter substrate-binding protein [Stellaceae bacterium]|nr:ABC transporter substrate-binding protein [Stellaceae bacterium]
MKRGHILAAAVLAAALARPAMAADAVKIGVLLPLTGNAAAAGQAAKAAIEVATEIINSAHPEMASLPLAASAGLPHLGGAKIDPIFVDHQGNPSVGQSQALRLITNEKVAALFGAYQSSVTFTATAAAERYGIPFVVGDSAAANITGRGFHWVFRVTPIAPDYAEAYMRFFADMKRGGHEVRSIGIVNENTDYGTSVGDAIEAAAKQHGVKVATRIPYSASSSDVSAQVLQLKGLAPDAVIFVSYTADAILYMKTMHNLQYLPQMIIGDDSGFSDPSFIPAVADIVQGVMNRSAWVVGKPGSATYAIDEMYKAKTGRDLDDTSGRDMEGFFVLADAIDRAGSTDPAKIQKALQQTDLKPAQLMMDYRGVKFDASGQNIEAATALIQLQGKQYVTVWPKAAALAPLQWPMKGAQ